MSAAAEEDMEELATHARALRSCSATGLVNYSDRLVLFLREFRQLTALGFQSCWTREMRRRK